MDKAEAKRQILFAQDRIHKSRKEMSDIARMFIPDFNPSKEIVSGWFMCDDSPIGMCVMSYPEGKCRFCSKKEVR